MNIIILAISILLDGIICNIFNLLPMFFLGNVLIISNYIKDNKKYYILVIIFSIIYNLLYFNSLFFNALIIFLISYINRNIFINKKYIVSVVLFLVASLVYIILNKIIVGFNIKYICFIFINSLIINILYYSFIYFCFYCINKIKKHNIN